MLFEEILSLLPPLAKESAVRLKFAVLEFNSEYRWITCDGPEDVEDFYYYYDYLEAHDERSVLGAALRELNSKLSRHAFLDSTVGSFFPRIMFITDGHATDDYQTALEEIRQNRWFRRAHKIAFSLSDDADMETLSALAGDRECVTSRKDVNAEIFKRLFRHDDFDFSDFFPPSSYDHISGADIIRIAKTSLDDAPDTITPDADDQAANTEDDEDWDW